MSVSRNERLQELLGVMYADIVQYAKQESLPSAEKSFYSIRDYALGDTVSCTAESALENCEQVKSAFAVGAPRSVFENIESVQKEIRRLENEGVPSLLGKVWIFIILGAVAFFIYFVLTHGK